MTQPVSTSTRRVSRLRDHRTMLLSTALLVLLLVAALSLSACSKPVDAPVTTEPSASTPPAGTEPTTPPAVSTELQIKDVKVGKGAEAKQGDTITVDYTGWLMDGTKFDSSVGAQPFTFVLGGGQVIPGWDQGFAGMKVGGKRELIIPSDLGYGPQGTPDGTIPPDSTLKFEVELLKVESAQ